MTNNHFFSRKILAFLALFFLTAIVTSPVQAAAPTAAEYGVVLNLSGKQRMLSQKMSKEVMLIALNADKPANLKNLAATAALFGKTLKGLRDGDSDLRLPKTSAKRILRQLKKIDKIWVSFNSTIQGILSSGSASKAQVAQIADQNLPLLKQMNKCVKLYEKDASKAGLKSDPSLAVTINLSGKQRMLTQKMSKEFLLAAYGHDVANNKLNLLETYSLFERTLKGLLDGDATLDLPGTKDSAIRQQLGVVQGLWASFKPIVANGVNPKTTSISASEIKTLAGSNLPLLKQMNKAVGMYAKAAAK
jgi:hypothetical protein